MSDDFDMEGSNLLHSQVTEEDSKESSVRPLCLDDFQGQSFLKENLRVFIDGAKSRTEALDHVFLSGPPGLGKTTLARIIAHEMGAEIKMTSAPVIDKPKDLAGLLTSLTPYSVFFIDEIHRMRSAIEEMLYVAMEDFALDWVIGQGPAARSVRIPLPPFTLIGATTRPGSVSHPLFMRFGIPLRLDFYSESELEGIAKRTAGILGMEVSPSALSLLASCSRGTPRVVNRILRRMRDFAHSLGQTVIDEGVVQRAFAMLRIDPAGLEEMDRSILSSVITKFGGGPVGLDTLAISVGESSDVLEDFYEPYLIQKGFLKRTPRGRVATPLAYEHLHLGGMQNNGDQVLFF